MKKNIIYSNIALLIIIGVFACESGVDPNSTIDFRNYEWAIDTIEAPLFYLTDISGTSADDVWAVGRGGGSDKTIWHYNGERWTTDGISRGIAPMGVFVVDDVVWIVGSEGMIWKNYGQWTFSAQLKLEGYQTIGFNNVWGSSKDDVYAVGSAVADNESYYRKSIIAHYDGNYWKIIDTKNEKCSFSSIKKNPITEQYFVSGKRNEPHLPDTSKLFILKDERLIRVEWEKEAVDDRIFIQTVGNELLFRMGTKMTYYDEGNFSTLINLNEKNFNTAFTGRNRKDIIIGTNDGIMQYNGKNLEYIYNAPRGEKLNFGRSVIFEKEIFLLESTNRIFHGKLKE